MKQFTNLPNNLRALFNLLRLLTIILAVFWTLTLGYNTWIQKRFGHDAHLMASIGEIALPAAPGAIGLSSNTSPAGTLNLKSLRGAIEVDLASQDDALASAVRQAIIPSVAALIVFSYVMFSALACVCGNLARGEVFNEVNLKLVRRIGLYLIAYSLVGAGLEVWASHVLGSYFHQHVVLTGLATNVPFAGGTGALHFGVPPALFTAQGGVLIGLLVLVVAEAFRQGLNLKTESDLTV